MVASGEESMWWDLSTTIDSPLTQIIKLPFHATLSSSQFPMSVTPISLTILPGIPSPRLCCLLSWDKVTNVLI